jgi:hypothetical protein
MSSKSNQLGLLLFVFFFIHVGAHALLIVNATGSEINVLLDPPHMRGAREQNLGTIWSGTLSAADPKNSVHLETKTLPKLTEESLLTVFSGKVRTEFDLSKQLIVDGKAPRKASMELLDKSTLYLYFDASGKVFLTTAPLLPPKPVETVRVIRAKAAPVESLDSWPFIFTRLPPIPGENPWAPGGDSYAQPAMLIFLASYALHHSIQNDIHRSWSSSSAESAAPPEEKKEEKRATVTAPGSFALRFPGGYDDLFNRIQHIDNEQKMLEFYQDLRTLFLPRGALHELYKTRSIGEIRIVLGDAFRANTGDSAPPELFQRYAAMTVANLDRYIGWYHRRVHGGWLGLRSADLENDLAYRCSSSMVHWIGPHSSEDILRRLNKVELSINAKEKANKPLNQLEEQIDKVETYFVWSPNNGGVHMLAKSGGVWDRAAIYSSQPFEEAQAIFKNSCATKVVGQIHEPELYQ